VFTVGGESKVKYKPRAAHCAIVTSILWLVLLTFTNPVSAAARSTDPANQTNNQTQAEDLVAELTNDQLEGIDTGEVEQYWDELMQDYQGIFPDSKTPTLQEMIRGENGFDLKTIIIGLLKYILYEVLYNGRLLLMIVLLTVCGMILKTLQTAFENNTISSVAYGIVFMVVIVLMINSFSVAIGYAREAISSMVDFMVAMIPLLLTMLATTGNVTLVAVMHPLIVFMINIVSTLVFTVVFPLLFFSAVLHIASTLSDKFKVTQLAGILRQIATGLLAVLLTVFLGVLSVKGATSAVTDGVTLKTAKFITGNFVPVVGRTFSDATDTIMYASMLVKNMVGLAGVIILLLLCAFPAIKILALAFIYNLAAAVMQPLGQNPIVGALRMIGKTLLYVFAALAVVSLMFFLAITIILTSGNIMMMGR
jgi:stage III sporulation protein AE